jgi:hypothetical protein
MGQAERGFHVERQVLGVDVVVSGIEVENQPLQEVLLVSRRLRAELIDQADAIG